MTVRDFSFHIANLFDGSHEPKKEVSFENATQLQLWQSLERSFVMIIRKRTSLLGNFFLDEEDPAIFEDVFFLQDSFEEFSYEKVYWEVYQFATQTFCSSSILISRIKELVLSEVEGIATQLDCSNVNLFVAYLLFSTKNFFSAISTISKVLAFHTSKEMCSDEDFELLSFARKTFWNAINRKMSVVQALPEIFDFVFMHHAKPKTQSILIKLIEFAYNIAPELDFSNSFVPSLLTQLNKYYMKTANEFVQENTFNSYSQLVSEFYQNEKPFFVSLDINTRFKVLSTFHDCFAFSQIESFSEALFDAVSHRDLAMCNHLFSFFCFFHSFTNEERIEESKPAIQKFSSQFSLIYESQLNRLIQSYTNDKRFSLIDQLLSHLSEFELINSKSFLNNSDVVISQHRRFHALINDLKQIDISVVLVSYFHKHLISQFALTQSDVAKMMDAVQIFRAISDKIRFEIIYRDFLIQRLLFHKSNFNMEAEQDMILKLQSECGSDYVRNLSVLLKDNSVSDKISQEFKQRENQPFSFSVSILSSRLWSNVPPRNSFSLPISYLSLLRKFEEYYSNCHESRRLDWIHTFDRFVLMFRERYRIVANFQQAIVLLCFNSRNKLLPQDIFNETGLENTQQTLAILRAKKILKGSSVLELDTAFARNIDLLKYAEKRVFKGDEKKIHETLENEKRNLVDSVLVRVMKSRKSARFDELQVSAIEQLQNRFVCSTQLLKERIETLVEREYIHRDKTDSSLFNYTV